jgi:hypothetical protein
VTARSVFVVNGSFVSATSPGGTGPRRYTPNPAPVLKSSGSCPIHPTK